MVKEDYEEQAEGMVERLRSVGMHVSKGEAKRILRRVNEHGVLVGFDDTLKIVEEEMANTKKIIRRNSLIGVASIITLAGSFFAPVSTRIDDKPYSKYVVNEVEPYDRSPGARGVARIDGGGFYYNYDLWPQTKNLKNGDTLRLYKIRGRTIASTVGEALGFNTSSIEIPRTSKLTINEYEGKIKWLKLQLMMN